MLSKKQSTIHLKTETFGSTDAATSKSYFIIFRMSVVSTWNAIKTSVYSHRSESKCNFFQLLNPSGDQNHQRNGQFTVVELMHEMNLIQNEITSSWNSGNRVESLKIIIQAANIMNHVTSDIFYPIQAFAFFDLLECFSNLVRDRIHHREDLKRNWEFKILSIKDFVPRVFLHASLLGVLYDGDDYDRVAGILFRMGRGFGNPIVSTYFQMFSLYQIGFDHFTLASKLAKSLYSIDLSNLDHRMIPPVRLMSYFLRKYSKKQKKNQNLLLIDGDIYHSNSAEIISIFNSTLSNLNPPNISQVERNYYGIMAKMTSLILTRPDLEFQADEAKIISKYALNLSLNHSEMIKKHDAATLSLAIINFTVRNLKISHLGFVFSFTPVSSTLSTSNI